MSRLRAIETGRAVVHVSTVGVSAIYTPTGAELERTGHFSAEQMMQELVLRDSRTPAVFLGEIPVWISWAGSVLLLVTGLFSRNRREVS
jgi:apolipoprotein N-acyltransferase